MLLFYLMIEPLKFEDVDYSNEPTRTPISENTSDRCRQKLHLQLRN
jgi:hypothetical protein